MFLRQKVLLPLRPHALNLVSTIAAHLSASSTCPTLVGIGKRRILLFADVAASHILLLWPDFLTELCNLIALSSHLLGIVFRERRRLQHLLARSVQQANSRLQDRFACHAGAAHQTWLRLILTRFCWRRVSHWEIYLPAPRARSSLSIVRRSGNFFGRLTGTWSQSCLRCCKRNPCTSPHI